MRVAFYTEKGEYVNHRTCYWNVELVLGNKRWQEIGHEGTCRVFLRNLREI